MEKFVLYVGLNDKDSKKQEIETQKAINLVCNILAKQGITDLTINTGLGAYTHEDGTRTFETSLIITMLFIERVQVVNAVSDIKTILNQECVALETVKVEKSELI